MSKIKLLSLVGLLALPHSSHAHCIDACSIDRNALLVTQNEILQNIQYILGNYTQRHMESAKAKEEETRKDPQVNYTYRVRKISDCYEEIDVLK